ncbi:MAG: HEPN domain-containing protein [Chloroflexi bacterium]|nr:HEPN domain-containing protein [Chloroflexota bacterium]
MRKSALVKTRVRPIGCLPVSQTLPKAVRRIARTLKPEKIILFGSYAYGKPTPDSDVDLLVVMKTEKSINERYLAVGRLLRPRQFPVDFIVKTPQEIKHAMSRKGNFIIQEIITNGKVLYERRKRYRRVADHAEDDFNSVQKLIRGKKPTLYGACFHSQQCAEKYMKAMLVFKGKRFPKTHDLIDINKLLRQNEIEMGLTEDMLKLLSSYAVRARYDAEYLEMADAKEAFNVAKSIRKFSRKFPGLK